MPQLLVVVAPRVKCEPLALLKQIHQKTIHSKFSSPYTGLSMKWWNPFFKTGSLSSKVTLRIIGSAIGFFLIAKTLFKDIFAILQVDMRGTRLPIVFSKLAQSVKDLASVPGHFACAHLQNHALVVNLRVNRDNLQAFLVTKLCNS